jgi:hypothetical protein
MGFWDTVTGIGDQVSQWAAPVASIATTVAPTLGKAVPALGTMVGLAQLAYHGIRAATSEGDERWDNIGSAVMGALGAIPGVGSYLAAGQLGFDLTMAGMTGGFSEAQDRGVYSSQLLGGLMRAGISDEYELGDIATRARGGSQ